MDFVEKLSRFKFCLILRTVENSKTSLFIFGDGDIIK